MINNLKKLKLRNKYQIKNATFFLFPLLVIITVVIIAPVVATFVNSLYNETMFTQGKPDFVGFKNYSNVIKSKYFWSILSFTITLTITAVFLEILIGIGITMVLKEKFRGSILVRTLVLIPWVIPNAINARIWQNIFEYNNGILNHILVNFFGIDRVNWYESAATSFWIIVTADIWKTTGFVVIILLTGYYAIPKDIFKQSKVDGCGMFKRLTKITLPILRPYIGIAIIFRVIDTLRIFDLIYELTDGGPGGTTQVLASRGFMYFKDMNYGMGSAFTTIAFIISLIIAIFIIKFGKLSKK